MKSEAAWCLESVDTPNAYVRETFFDIFMNFFSVFFDFSGFLGILTIFFIISCDSIHISCFHFILEIFVNFLGFHVILTILCIFQVFMRFYLIFLGVRFNDYLAFYFTQLSIILSLW